MAQEAKTVSSAADILHELKILLVRSTFKWDGRSDRATYNPEVLALTRLNPEEDEELKLMLQEGQKKNKDEIRDFARVAAAVEDQVSAIVAQIGALESFARLQGTEGHGGYLEGEKLVQLWEAVGIACAMCKLTKHQLMKFLGEVKRLKLAKREDFTYEKIVMLRPHLAYATARSEEMREVHQVLDACFGVFQRLQSSGLSDPTELKRQFDRFCDFVEAIVAYHRYYYKEVS